MASRSDPLQLQELQAQADAAGGEAARLRVLRSYQILDTPPEREYDDITRLAAAICGTPIALVSLVDAARQWFKSRVGVDVTETPRSIAFCDYGIRSSALFVVPDAAADPRFRENPMVVGGPRIRFYAGAPLTTPEGANIGMLCVKDRVPRVLGPQQLEALAVLANVVVRQMELRRKLRVLAEVTDNLGVARDRTEKTNATLSAVFEATHEGLLALDGDSHVTTFNERFLHLWGLTAAHVAGASVAGVASRMEALLRTPAGPFVTMMKAGDDASGGPLETFELTDGRWIECACRPQTIHGRPSGRLWSFRDVTTRREAEQKAAGDVERAFDVRQLQEMGALKTRLINLAAHELNTPMSAMRMQLFLLEGVAKEIASPALDQALTIFDRSVDRMTRVVQDTLEAVRLNTDAFAPTAAIFPLADVVHEVAETLRGARTRQAQTLQTELAPGLLASGDRERIAQVLYHLVDNAIKFTPPGGAIAVRARPDGGRLSVEVHDTGIGLTPAQQARLFRPFERVHDDDQLVVKGVGLGLYVSHEIVARHGGRLRGSSPGPSHGSTFTFDVAAAANG